MKSNRKARLHRTWVITLTIAGLIMPHTSTGAAKDDKKPLPPAIELGAPFRDHAILQRDKPVPVWGWSNPGTEVTVTFSEQTKKAIAGKDGKWIINLDPLKANSEPTEMVITEAEGKTVTLKDILVGEVWLASGQSNMQWPVGKCDVGGVLVKEINDRVKAGKEVMPQIREVSIPGFEASLLPQEKSEASWSTDWQGFSAISFAFAYELERELKVPIGIVNCSFSMTPIQAWAHCIGFRDGKDQFTKDIYQKILVSDPATPEHKQAWDAYYESLREWSKEAAEQVKKGMPVSKAPRVPGILSGNRGPTWLYNGKTHPMAPYAMRGVIWNQGYANGPEGFTYRNYLHSLVRSFRLVWNEPELPVYFHQFYNHAKAEGFSFDAFAEMRLGTWIAHLEIPNASMASQIDIVGGVHYRQKIVPGQRLAYHALKNQYHKDVIANGPMYKDYRVEGNKLILELDHAEGLTVGGPAEDQSRSHAVVLENAEDQVKLFYLADNNKTWHQARIKIVGETIELTAPGLKDPAGVAYGCTGVGTEPSIYNKAMLPLTPFIFFEHKLVVSNQHDLDYIKIPNPPFEIMTWPLEYLPLADRKVDPTTYGIQLEHVSLPLLSPQFRNGAVIQAGVPTRLYGAALPNSVVKVTFAGLEKTIQVGPHESEWEATFDALEASDKPLTIYASCTIDGKLAHERTITNVLIGDVWYVSINQAAMFHHPGYPNYLIPDGPVRMFQSRTKKATNPMPDRFKLTESGFIASRFYAVWEPPVGIARILGERIHAITGKPVGVIVMNTQMPVPIKSMVGFEWLDQIPEWKNDRAQLYNRYVQDPSAYSTNTTKYIDDWKAYWKRIEQDPSFATSNESAGIPVYAGAAEVDTQATMVYNLNVVPYGPANFKGVISLTPPSYMGDDHGATFGKELSTMANCWKDTFARGKQVIDPHFVYTLPTKELAPNITVPKDIKGASTAVEVSTWTPINKTDPKTRHPVINDDVTAVIDAAVKAVYRK